MEKNLFKTIRFKLFITLCIVILMIVFFFVIINSAILESIFYYKKNNALLNVYEYVNQNIPKTFEEDNKDRLSIELEKISENNNFELLIKNNQDIVYTSSIDFSNDYGTINDINYNVNYSIFNKSDIMFSDSNISVRKINNRKNGLNYILLKAKLDNENEIYIRMSETSVVENIEVSDNFIYVMGLIAIILGGIAITVITEKFTKPIEELNDIAKEMTNLNFKTKYRIHDTQDEVEELGKSINILSDKLEETINQLKINNLELEKDIEEKSKIDEMRKQFISDVSHELKTPIALIQGYAEGLSENVVTDDESRKFYTDVILDEADKMDKLVKSLLELMKLEYGEREFNDRKFDIVEIINAVIKNSKVMLDEEKIDVVFDEKKPIYVFADDFYIEQVVTNYFTNAIKNNDEINGKKYIKITIKKSNETGKLRVTVFNTGKHIDDEYLNKIWTRFYKVDTSRNRSKGGTGIGLSLVKAIMNKYNNAYGVKNKKDGVEFYFDLNEMN